MSRRGTAPRGAGRGTTIQRREFAQTSSKVQLSGPRRERRSPFSADTDGSLAGKLLTFRRGLISACDRTRRRACGISRWGGGSNNYEATDYYYFLVPWQLERLRIYSPAGRSSHFFLLYNLRSSRPPVDISEAVGDEMGRVILLLE